MSCGPEKPGDFETPQCGERDLDREESEITFRGPLIPPETPGGLHHALVGRPVTAKPEFFDGSEDWQDYVVYFEQLAELNGWDRPTMAIMLGLSLRGAARTVLAGLSLPERRDYKVLKAALTQNFSPHQKVHMYMAELKARRRKPHESLADLGRDIARLTRLAYPNADQATRETIGINAFLDSMPGPAIEIRLHVVKGHPATLQEAVAYAMEVDVILESHGSSTKRSNVRKVEDTEEESITSALKIFAESLKQLEGRLDKLEKTAEKAKSRKSKANITCFNCGQKGHYKNECRNPPKSGNEPGLPNTQ